MSTLEFRPVHAESLEYDRSRLQILIKAALANRRRVEVSDDGGYDELLLEQIADAAAYAATVDQSDLDRVFYVPEQKLEPNEVRISGGSHLMLLLLRLAAEACARENHDKGPMSAQEIDEYVREMATHEGQHHARAAGHDLLRTFYSVHFYENARTGYVFIIPSEHEAGLMTERLNLEIINGPDEKSPYDDAVLGVLDQRA